VPREAPGIQLERLGESIGVIKDLLEHGRSSRVTQHYAICGMNGPLSRQRPYPPFVIGARGPRMLALAGREATTVSVQGRGTLTMADSIELVIEAAQNRPMFPELNVVMQKGDRCDQYHLGGSTAEMADFLQRQRDELGISYIGYSDIDSTPDDWAVLVANLAGH
jgi:hypothetical protein